MERSKANPSESAIPVPRARPATSGTLRVRVRYCECDPMGVAHHAAYIPWLEMARTELLRESGVSYAQLEAAGVFLVVAKLEVAYRRPVYYDDVVEVRTRVVGANEGESASRVKIRHEYEVVLVESDSSRGRKREAGEVLCAASSVLACVGRHGRVRELPAWLLGSG